MELTGKCKEDFEEWYDKQHLELPLKNVPYETIGFESICESMQYGVYVDFFDSVNIDISVKLSGYFKFDYSIKDKESHSLLFTEYDWSNSRLEARTKAINKANEIYNQ